MRATRYGAESLTWLGRQERNPRAAVPNALPSESFRVVMNRLDQGTSWRETFATIDPLRTLQK
jgi:hypothetical protein